MRVIDAEALKSYMDECSKESKFRVYYGYAESFIDDAPTIDAVPVVRCRECKYRDGTPGQPNILCGQMHEDDFCSYGERKGGQA